MKISVVIPTRNRPHYMSRVLTTLQQQIRKAEEIIVIDSSDQMEYRQGLKEQFSSLPISWIQAPASVCLQRNIGIREASGDWIFLCDDDIELDQDYLAKLEEYSNVNPDCGAVAGCLLQNESGNWVSQYPPRNFGDLLWRFAFQLSVWGDLQSITTSTWTKPILYMVKQFYRRRGNNVSLAGWPLITSWDQKYFQTKIYSLGANLIKREWLLNSPYDEVLDPSGIGDNYGVALGFPKKNAIHVLCDTHAHHHRAEENRLLHSIAYFRRTLALHYFLKRHRKRAQRLWFIWSLLGNWIHQKIRRNELSNATLKAIKLVLTGKNPYWEGFVKNKKNIQPPL
jgi:glycosyltransferase involved in cell wall biosynthesis